MRLGAAVMLVAVLISGCGGEGAFAGGETSTPVLTTPQLTGEELFETFFGATGKTCSGCHRLDDEDGPFAPTLKGVSVRAADRVEGLSDVEYLRQSIVDPEAFQVEGWPQGMPTNYAEVFSEHDIDRLIEFLLTQ